MKKFYLGLDIGTESVGIACTDEDYNLLRAKGKDLWAVRLFDEASTAKDRRAKRAARRRLMRRAQRIDTVQALLSPFIEDKLFFARLNNSGFLYEDKDERLQSPYSLFADKEFTDKQFYKRYPTIFHLRKALIEGKEKADLRLYYLALHHIVKYRGHFLFENQSMSEIRDVKKLFESLNAAAEDCFDEDVVTLSAELAERFKEIALSSKRNGEKLAELKDLFGKDDEKRKKEILSLMLGLSGKPYIIFDDDGLKEKKSICFKNMQQEEFAALEDDFGDRFDYLAAIKNVYDFTVFERILGGRAYISDAMVAIYEKHASDLKLLKAFVNEHCGHEVYKEVFKSTELPNNYVAYVGYTKVGKSKKFVKRLKDVGELYKYLRKIIEKSDAPSGEQAKQMLDDMDNGNFLPKILNADNGLFPHQINGDELKRILTNLCRDYPSVAEKGEDGLSISDKILKVFEFKIPYYVGPLNPHGENGWMVRKGEGKITPWNFDSLVDKAASNEQFMRRMTNKCSYLYAEDTLPKCSILYQKYDVLNQINKLKIDEQPISVELKQAIFEELFLKEKKVTKKRLRRYLTDRGYRPLGEESKIDISGFDGEEITASMRSYIILKEKLGEDFVSAHPEVCEDIILWHTLNTDKNVVERLISEKYGRFPQIKDNIKALKGITSFKDFGSLSKRLLCGIKGVDKTTGVVDTIIGVLYSTNLNLNQILWSQDYDFKEKIDEENGNDKEGVEYDTLKDMGLSPAVRRGVWQALTMADEYITALKRTPDKIFVEVTRGGGEKGKRTVSRKRSIEKLYEQVKDIDELRAELNKNTDAQLRQERLYLYFLQLGKCAYTGEQISLDELNGELYDVDHIMPQSLVKDDSIDNKVLVKRKSNKEKSDTYPLPDAMRQVALWKTLKEKGLMSDKKYALLTRTAPLSDKDYQDFIARQIVFTGQMSKAVAELLKRKYGNSGTKVVYSKSGNVADFKQKYGIVKCRETNDLHHARDAYLNIVVGNVYETRFGGVYNYHRECDDSIRRYNLKTLFDRPIEGAWKGSESVVKVKQTVQKCSMAVTRYAIINHGSFYNETIYPGDDGAQYPRKAGNSPLADMSKYGGYKSPTTAYFAIVESLGKKNKKIKTIEAVPVIVDYRLKTDPNAVIDYLVKEKELKEPKILIEKLKIKTLLEVNGTPVRIAGAGDARIIFHNAIQWFTDGETDEYVNALSKLADWKKNGKVAADSAETEFVMNTNRKGEVTLSINAERNMALFDKMVGQLSKKAYGGISGMAFFRNTLEKRRTDFAMLTVLQQAEVLLQIAKALKCNAELADLKMLNEGSRGGLLRLNKNITEENIVIIHSSPCGLIERRIKL